MMFPNPAKPEPNKIELRIHRDTEEKEEKSLCKKNRKILLLFSVPLW